MVFDEEDMSSKRRSQYLSHINGMRRVAQANSGRRMALCARSGTFIWTRLGRASCAKRRPDACARRMRVPQFNWTDSEKPFSAAERRYLSEDAVAVAIGCPQMH